jgi:hypothetical protein
MVRCHRRPERRRVSQMSQTRVLPRRPAPSTFPTVYTPHSHSATTVTVVPFALMRDERRQRLRTRRTSAHTTLSLSPRRVAIPGVAFHSPTAFSTTRLPFLSSRTGALASVLPLCLGIVDTGAPAWLPPLAVGSSHFCTASTRSSHSARRVNANQRGHGQASPRPWPGKSGPGVTAL